MKRYCTLIGIALLTALFVYLFYRTEKTVVNMMMSSVLGKTNTTALRHFFRTHLPLPDVAVYSLPGALWVFSATLVSRNLYIKLRRFTIPLCIFPMLYATAMECLQWAHWLPGTFDRTDILLAIGLGIAAKTMVRCPLPVQHIFYRYSYRTTSLIYVYGIVLLSHVQR